MNYTSRYHHEIHTVDRVKDPVAQDPPDAPDPVKLNGPQCPTLPSAHPSYRPNPVTLPSAIHKLKIFKAVIPPLPHLGSVLFPAFGLWLVLIEVSRISRSPKVRYDWALHFAVVECAPINISEPGVRFYGACAAFDVA